MATLEHGGRRIYFEVAGPADGPACVLVNGLTQYVKLWHPFRDALVTKGFHVVSYDMLGQGQSTKPSLFIPQDDQVAVLGDLIAELGQRPIFVAGISFGGVIALRYAIEHGETIAGLVPMSSFAEIPTQLLLLGTALRSGLILGGTTFLQDLLFPMNFSGEWLELKRDLIELARHRGWLINDVYALQNLMELFLDFEPLTTRLSAICVPTMILTGEFDFLTPRALQELAAHPHPGQRNGHYSPRLSRVHAGETAIDCLFARGFCRGRAGGPLVRQADNLGRAGRSRRRAYSLSCRLRPFARDTSTQRVACACRKRRRGGFMSVFLGPLDEDGRVPANQQTRVSAFLMSAHGAQARQLAAALPGSLHNGWQVELHSQYCREMEIFSLIARATSWVPDPTLAFLLWRWEAAWLPKPVEGTADHHHGLLIDMAAFGHAVHSVIRPAALLPEFQPHDNPFGLAMKRIEFESGRLLQAQILFLKGPQLLPVRDTVAAAVERRHAQVRELWTGLLGDLLGPAA